MFLTVKRRIFEKQLQKYQVEKTLSSILFPKSPDDGIESEICLVLGTTFVFSVERFAQLIENTQLLEKFIKKSVMLVPIRNFCHLAAAYRAHNILQVLEFLNQSYFFAIFTAILKLAF